MENPWVITLIVFGLMIVLLATGMWISTAMAVTGLVLVFFIVGGTTWQTNMIAVLQVRTVALDSWTWAAVPMFVFMGEILFYSGISDRLYGGATPLVGFLPGGLLHTNIAACAIFSAVSASSMATAATVGTVAIPEMEKRGYDRSLVLGSLAAGGTLGILIPPSLGFILYGAFVNESIGKLFIAGAFPGIVLAGLFMLYIGIAALRKPSLAPERLRFSPRAIGWGILQMWPIFVLIFMVMGTIYLGVATPIEAAAMGAVAAMVLCALYRKFTFSAIKGSALAAIKICAWIMLLIIGSKIVGIGLSMLKVPAQLAEAVTSLGVGRIEILVILIVLYIVLGMFLEGVPMLVLTLPVVYPMMMKLGVDSVWLGVMMVLFMEMGQITPPVGINLYVILGLTGKKYLRELLRGVIPFVFCQLVVVVLLIAFPSIALWLPNQMFKPY